MAIAPTADWDNPDPLRQIDKSLDRIGVNAACGTCNPSVNRWTPCLSGAIIEEGGPSMSITLDLSPELEQRIESLAAACGLAPEAYLVSVFETSALPAIAEHATLEQFEAAMDEMAERMDDIPVLAPDALSRESIYGHRA